MINKYEENDIMIAPLYMTLMKSIRDCEDETNPPVGWWENPHRLIETLAQFRDEFTIVNADKRLANIIKAACDQITPQLFEKEGPEYCMTRVVWLAGRTLIHERPSVILNADMGLLS